MCGVCKIHTLLRRLDLLDLIPLLWGRCSAGGSERGRGVQVCRRFDDGSSGQMDWILDNG